MCEFLSSVCVQLTPATDTAVRLLESSWNVMADGDAWKGKWRGNWRMEWVASTLHTTSPHGVSSITTADAHTSAASRRLNWRSRRFKWTCLVHFAERRIRVSARVPSYFRRSLPSDAPAPCWTATRAHPCHQGPTTSHRTHCWPCTVRSRNICADRRVLQHCSGPCRNIRRNLTANCYDCNYEKSRRKEQPDTKSSDGLSGVVHWTAINIPHTCLVSRRLQRRSARYDVTLLINSQGRHQGHTNTARQVGRATDLGTVAPTICGSWVRKLVHVAHLASEIFSSPTFMENWYTSGVECWQNCCWTGSFEGLKRGRRLCELYAFLGHQVAWHIILCVSQSTYPQEHVWMKCRIYTQNSVPVSLQMYLQTGDLHVLYIIYWITRQRYLIPRSSVLLEKLPVSQLVKTPTVYVTRKLNTEEAAGGLEDKFVYEESKPQFMCRTAS
jgi:hypothetical protein